jgi:hypothetical protein
MLVTTILRRVEKGVACMRTKSILPSDKMQSAQRDESLQASEFMKSQLRGMYWHQCSFIEQN